MHLAKRPMQMESNTHRGRVVGPDGAPLAARITVQGIQHDVTAGAKFGDFHRCREREGVDTCVSLFSHTYRGEVWPLPSSCRSDTQASWHFTCPTVTDHDSSCTAHARRCGTPAPYCCLMQILPWSKLLYVQCICAGPAQAAGAWSVCHRGQLPWHGQR